MAMQKKGMMSEFRDFIAKGNVLDLAVAIVLGIAFGAVINAMVDGIVMPLIAAAVGEPSFDSLIWTVNDSAVLYGTFLTQLVNFLIVGLALFMIVRTATRLQQRRVVDLDEEAKDEPSETEVLMEIRDLLSRSDIRSVR